MDTEMSAPQNEPHVHDENCGIIPGFENFGEKEYEFSMMVIEAVNKMMGPLVHNVVESEIRSTVERSVPLPPEVTASINHETIPEELNNLIALGVFSGAKSLAMAMVALGAVDTNVVINNQPPPTPSFQEFLEGILGGAKVDVFAMGKNSEGEPELVPLFDPEKDEKPSPVDRSRYELSDEEANRILEEETGILGTNDDTRE